MQPHRRRGRAPGRRPLLVAGAVLLGLLVAAPLTSLPAARALEASVTGDLQAAQAELQHGLAELEDGYRNQDARQVRAAAAAFGRSRDRLRALGGRVRPFDAARGAGAPDFLRGRAATLDAVIDVATRLDEAGTSGARALLLSGLVAGPGAAQPAVDVAELTDLLGGVREQLAAAAAAARGIDLAVLPDAQPAPLAQAPDPLRTALSR